VIKNHGDMKLRLLLIFLIGFSIAVQNTCPFGLAGKIGFMPKEVRHCHLKKQLPAKANADCAKKATLQTGQAFVFIVGNADTTAPLFSQEIASFFPEMNFYEDIYWEPPVKPPSIV